MVKYSDLLSAWALNKEIGSIMVKDDLPCHRDTQEATDQIYSCLQGQGFIKACAIRFCKHGSEDTIDDQKAEIRYKLKLVKKQTILNKCCVFSIAKRMLQKIFAG